MAELRLPTTQPAAWLNPIVRTHLVAARPWSFPMSLVAVTLAATVLVTLGEGVALEYPALAACYLTTLGVHAAANLVNTYCDYQHGADTLHPATSDRTLVDGMLSPPQVLRSAAGCLTLSVGLGAALTRRHDAPSGGAYLFAAGALIAVFYTAAPLRLKCRALGDVAVMTSFGPLLMAWVASVLTGTVDLAVLLYSVPPALLAEAVLHANNARDAEADRRAGVYTLARALGPGGSFRLYVGLLWSCYAWVAALAAAHLSGMDHRLLGAAVVPTAERAWRLGIVLYTLPWALYVAECFRRGSLAELPEKTAQFGLLFNALLVAALMPPHVLGRALVASLFVLGGINNVMQWTYTVALLEQKMENLAGGRRCVPPGLVAMLLACAVAMQVLAAALLALGVASRTMAALLLAWLMGVTVVMHDFWTVGWADGPKASLPTVPPDAQATFPNARVPTFVTLFDNEFVHFFKNLVICGGLLLHVLCGTDEP